MNFTKIDPSGTSSRGTAHIGQETLNSSGRLVAAIMRLLPSFGSLLLIGQSLRHSEVREGTGSNGFVD
jgi:hypothetical protein